MFYFYTFIFNRIAAPEIMYFYWYITIFFFFMLKTISNISKYSIFNYFILFFNLKRFLISLIVISSASFFNFKRFVTSLIIYSFSKLDLSTIISCKKSWSFFFFFKKKTTLYYPSEKAFKNSGDFMNYVNHDKFDLQHSHVFQ